MNNIRVNVNVTDRWRVSVTAHWGGDGGHSGFGVDVMQRDDYDPDPDEEEADE